MNYYNNDSTYAVKQNLKYTRLMNSNKNTIFI